MCCCKLNRRESWPCLDLLASFKLKFPCKRIHGSAQALFKPTMHPMHPTTCRHGDEGRRFDKVGMHTVYKHHAVPCSCTFYKIYKIQGFGGGCSKRHTGIIIFTYIHCILVHAHNQQNVRILYIMYFVFEHLQQRNSSMQGHKAMSCNAIM